MTDTEELELEMEQARARKAQAEQDAATQEAESGGGSPLGGAVKSVVRGMGRGFANIPEPLDVATGIINAPIRLVNASKDLSKTYAPAGAQAGQDIARPTPLAPSGQSQIEHP